MDEALADRFARVVSRARSALAVDAGALWGVDLSACRWIGAADDRWYATAEPAAAGFVRTADGLWVGPPGAGVTRANTSVDWDGRRWAMVLLPLDSTVSLRASTCLLIHEALHTVQARLFDMHGNTEPRADAEVLDRAAGRVWLRLELRALAAALAESTPEGTRQRLSEALAFRMCRLEQATPAEADRQRCLEIGEGMPEYTGRRLAGDSGADVSEAIRRCDDAAGKPDSAALIRSFAYVTGPAYGFAYDQAGHDWRSRVRASLDLGKLGVPAAADPGGLAVGYRVDAVVAEERARDQRHRQVQAADAAVYVQGPTLRLPMSPSGVTFNPQSVRSYAFGTVYAGVTARWDDAELTAAEALITPDWRSVHVQMPLAALPSAGQPGRCAGAVAVFDYGADWRFERDGACVVASRVDAS